MSKEIFKDLEETCTRIKKDLYHMRTEMLKLTFDPPVMMGLVEHIDKIYGEFDSVQEFCKSRT